MEPIYRQEFIVDDYCVDCFGRLKPSTILLYAQEMAGRHCQALCIDPKSQGRNLFWAVSRHRVQITRLPMLGEHIRLETWPMPTTKVAYPRSVIAYDDNGQECFRSVTLWVLVDWDTRNMILPGKSGIAVTGTVRGLELATPKSVLPALMENHRSRTVCFTDLDGNGHMNNTRYLDWVDDLLPSSFHENHTIKEFTACYLSEALEGQDLHLSWQFTEDGVLQMDAHREKTDDPGKEERVFAARIQF